MSHVYNNINIGTRLDVNPTGRVITTAKGQLITDNGTKSIAQAVGADNQFLVADSAQATGLIWRDLTPTDVGLIAGDGLTLVGDQLDVGGSATIFANADNLVVNSSATADQVLLSSGTVGTAAAYGALPLNGANSVTGVLAVTNGGTGSSSFTAADMIVATNGANNALIATGINPADIAVQTDTLTTTDATATLIYTISTVSDEAYTVTATFMGKEVNSPFAVASFQVTATFNNIAGVLTMIGSNDLVYVPNTTTWTVDMIAAGTDIYLRVIGAAATDIDWKVRVAPILVL